ncbi:MAG: ABC transporter permease [Planctomycetota bacterium]
MGLFRTIAELKGFGFLLEQTVVREIRVRYKQTLIGMSWAVIQPTVLAIIFYFVLGVFRGWTGGLREFGAIYASISLWTFFNNAVILSTTSISGHPQLVTKVRFPRTVFPLSFIAVSAIDLMVNAVIAMALLAIAGSSPTANQLGCVGLSVMGTVALTAAFSILFSGLNVFYRDFRYVVPILLQVIFFVTPVFYSLDRVPEAVRNLVMCNPMTSYVLAVQAPYLDATPPMMLSFISLAVSVAALDLSCRAFARLNDQMADVI